MAISCHNVHTNDNPLEDAIYHMNEPARRPGRQKIGPARAQTSAKAVANIGIIKP